MDGLIQSLITYMPKHLGIPQTLRCKIITPKGKTSTIRALMDPGSQFTALRKGTAKQLSLNGPKRTLISGTSGAQQLTLPNQRAIEFKLSSLDDSYVTNFNVEAVTMQEVTHDICPINIDPLKFWNRIFNGCNICWPHVFGV